MQKQLPDLHNAALHGSFVVFRSLLEFAGLKSHPKRKPAQLVEHISSPKRESDIQIRHFGHALVPITDPWVTQHSDLLAITHDGVSKACAHLTWGSGHAFDVNTHYIAACGGLLDLLDRYLYKLEHREMMVMPSLSHANWSAIEEVKKHKPI